MARKIFTVIAVLMFILTLSSCQKGVSQQEYDGLKAQLDTANSELTSYKESAEQAEADLSDLKNNVAIAKQYIDIFSAMINMSTPDSPGTDVEKMVAITTMVNDTGNQKLIDEWSKVINATGSDTTQSDQAMFNVFSMVLEGIDENTSDL
ncbi:hypothetical protein ES695_20105 [Candidatus Atribacteria bacterium 1244-E10-H5-B2]|nr:MAG: hypothetical protein ES695_20105 [Candidatus Atribacteria bacterium 1244-E10-H5-B2]